MDVGPPEVGLIGHPALPPSSSGTFWRFFGDPALGSRERPHSSMIKLLDGLSEGVGVGFNQGAGRIMVLSEC
jgi:hypothetical protein